MTETFAWNSSHRRGSGPPTQTRTVDSFRIHPFNLAQRPLYEISWFFSWFLTSSKISLRSPLATELISRSTCECPKATYNVLVNFFPAFSKLKSRSQKPPSYRINFQERLWVSQSQINTFSWFFPWPLANSKLGPRNPQATELNSSSTCECLKATYTVLVDFFPGFINGF